MKKQDSVIITEPHLTHLFTGQLIDPEAIPKIAKELEVGIDDIKYVPYDSAEHKRQIKRSRKQYDDLIPTKEYHTVFDKNY